MRGYFRVPLAFLSIGSLLGVFLRWQFIAPTPGVTYAFFLHAHSHVMFLGWIFNALYIAFCYNHIAETEISSFKKIFVVLQGLVVGMLISFPLQGYGFYSILFSTAHTICVFIFIVMFFRRTQGVKSVSAWFARTALVFFVISTAGPFSLGYLMSNQMGHTNWYFFSIYFYLHFQYNGFFIFGILSLFFNLLERKKIQFHLGKARTFGWTLAIVCLPTYLLSILWAKPGLTFNAIAGASAFIQFIALGLFIKVLIKHRLEIGQTFSKASIIFLFVILFAFILKLFLQAISALPGIAQLAYELRPVVIAYLHMVLIGIISLFVFLWYMEFDFIDEFYGKKIVGLFLISFIGVEVCLTFSPWWSILFGRGATGSQEYIFFFSIVSSLCCLLLFASSFSEKTDKDQYLD
jgi:hypothetical protein